MAGFSDVVIGDADIADIHPITDKALSILGKKLGTTRVSVYGEAKRLIGVFDVEVAYDTTLLQDELKRRFPTARIRVTSVNGRIMLTGSAPDGVVLDKAVMIAKQFGPEVINSVSVDAPQQVMLEVRFIEASRTAGRELGVKWDINARDGHSDNFAALVGTAGLVSGGTPFGQIAGRLIAKGPEYRRHRQCTGGKESGAKARRTEPGGALGRYRELPGGRRIPRSRSPATTTRSPSNTSGSASASRSRRPF